MNMLDVRQPDFGFLTDAMRHDGEMPISELLIQPRAEGELAFVLKSDLVGPGITNAQVLSATEQCCRASKWWTHGFQIGGSRSGYCRGQCFLRPLHDQ